MDINIELFEQRINCPICNHSVSKNLLFRNTNDFDFKQFLIFEKAYGTNYFKDLESGLLKKQEFIIQQCQKCEFIFQQCILNEIGMAKLYDSWLDSELVHQLTFKLVNYNDLRRDYHNRLAYITAYFGGRKVKMLDWGAGIGNFCNEAKSFGDFEITAYDYSEEKNISLEKLGIQTKKISELLPNEYDFINVDQVLEHVKDPLLLIKTCSQFLQPNGLLFISTPNCSKLIHLIKKGILNEELHEFISPHQHINAFVNKSLKHLAAQAGFVSVFEPFKQFKASLETVNIDKKIFKNLIKPFYREFASSSLFFKKENNSIKQ